MTLTFNPKQARVKVNRHAKNQGRRSNNLAMRAQTDRQTDRQTHGTNNNTSFANAEVNEVSPITL